MQRNRPGFAESQQQGYGVYTWDHYNRHGRNLLELTPPLKLGVLPGLQLDLSAPYNLGDQSTANQGNVSADAFYQVTDPRPNFPALAVQGGYRFAEYGAGYRSNLYFLRGLVTQWLGDSEQSPRLHLNLNWAHVTQSGSGGRSDILEVGLAYSQLVSQNTALVLDLGHGAKLAVRQDQNVIDVGCVTRLAKAGQSVAASRWNSASNRRDSASSSRCSGRFTYSERRAGTV